MFRALRHRNFRLFFTGQAISLTGTWMQTLAQSWLVYRLTGSPALLGAVGFASQVPVLFLGPIAGIVADRHRRHRIVVATQIAMMLQAFVLAALTLSQTITVWEIFVLAVVLGICNAYDIPARQAFLVEMVGSDDLMNAIALNSSMFNGARIVGPAVAGLLVAALGEGLCFLLNGITFLFVIAGLLMMKIESRPPQKKPGGRMAQLQEGFAYAWRNVAIRSLLLLLGLISLLGMSYVVLMPVFAEEVLRSGPRGLGGLLTAGGCGALIAALWMAGRGNLFGLGQVVAWASAGFGLSLSLFAFSRIYWLSALCLVPAGFCLMVQMACTNTLIQSLVGDAMRGRVMGLYTTMFLGMAPFGSLLAGFLAEHLGAPAAVAIGGIASAVGAFGFWARLGHLRLDEQVALVVRRAES